ncbi:MAG: transglutaminase family protein [Moraxellaceae bacterium]|nr:transglutaminase family protein [Moraxellaceae bacterium]
MSIHVALNHITHYRYDRPIQLGPQVVRLRPAPHSRTRVLSYSMRVTPEKHFINWQQDPQSNYLARLVFPEKTTEFRVEIDLVVEMAVLNPFDFFLEPGATNFPFKYDASLATELAPYLVKAPLTPKFAAYVDKVPKTEQHTVDFLVAVNQMIQKDIDYTIRMEPGVQTPEQTLEKALGSCRDSGWLLVQLMRHLGLAARFVSGYLIQLKPDVKSLDGPSGTEVDFTDLHAWCEVYLPGAGWIGLDPTSGLLAGEGHIPLACSPEPSSAAPISGVLEECEVEFEHHMRVDRIWEAPRVTKPYTDEQWADISELGLRIDSDLKLHDVRLTQGGEPTFVSVDDRDGAEWNTDALGPKKRGLSAELLAKLKAKYAPEGLLHYGQGKWYPGEQLPRWSLNLFWRKDGEPVWSRPELFADEKKDYGVTEVQAAGFLRALTEKLGLESKHVFPAFEDVWYYLWRERRLPANVDPFDARLTDPLERDRLRKVFTQGLDKTIGWVLPIARSHSGPERWQTGPWFLRDERCYLIPGDSALGYRLPLDSQPWVSQGEYPWIHQPDPTQSFPPLPPYRRLRTLSRAEDANGAAWNALQHDPYAELDDPQGLGGLGGVAGLKRREADRLRSRSNVPTDAAPGAFQSAGWITRTAMCAEPRDGKLYLFMPPTAALEDYLEIVSAIEATAAELALPVVLEGYEPPKDPRLTTLRVTPDPGVIEVNIHPASSWNELVDQTTHLYDAAHHTRLSTEKFMLDGRHGGTGGGNHFVLGGATPGDSPFLRRPDVLASMIAYWHNHPALSYLFSGMFIGPTSQAPRIDEARNDSVYEIEIAFREMQRLSQQWSGSAPPWQVDRLLRNLLIDVTGNTHRAEFCIDKLYSPDSSSGRLGLLEMRAFEMPPHAQMSLTQQLLMRALVSRFWQHPYQPPRIKRWGTELHDRFMLPHFVWDDLQDVMDELQDFGYPLQADWFAPHLEFRFPKLGDFAAKSVDVELRMALEPWHVMGEEGAPGGTVRYVDSSVERLQVKVDGLVGDRHVLSCNGRVVPLQPTGNVGEYVAGVRYRAWWPSSALHPTIGVHAPLTFDLVDTWMDRSLGGCQYHVAHPGGRNYVTFPVNAFEAEARRLNRFFRMGHTPGKVEVHEEPRNPDFPFTLDLRRT